MKDDKITVAVTGDDLIARHGVTSSARTFMHMMRMSIASYNYYRYFQSRKM